MTSAHFKDVAHTLATACGNAGVTLDVYAILHLTEALIDMGFDATEPVEPVSQHERLVSLALNSHEVLSEVGRTRKINAIKALRSLAIEAGVFAEGAGTLKATKEAVEDSRVEAAGALFSNPWQHDFDRDEPPF